MVGTNCLGSSGNFGASTAWICSVDAVYDWASFIISPPASARVLAYWVLAFVTAESDGPPSWLPTSVAFAACASSTERALTLWFRSSSSCGLTSCSVSAAWPSHLPAFSL
ncbi:hypothetical protein ACFYOR_34400 [Streptomyces griseofuscus]|uniref:hypothetical protein n=1 Tax=Streptomyces TaxID=1883 RepID=UPI0018F10197|nr:hypothetical protein [Streptomyces sp. CRPSP2-6A1]MBJ7002722.1 hypothetical protein [Streptomyces sp. CRPSP2-6A1]